MNETGAFIPTDVVGRICEYTLGDTRGRTSTGALALVNEVWQAEVDRARFDEWIVFHDEDQVEAWKKMGGLIRFAGFPKSVALSPMLDAEELRDFFKLDNVRRYLNRLSIDGLMNQAAISATMVGVSEGESIAAVLIGVDARWWPAHQDILQALSSRGILQGLGLMGSLKPEEEERIVKSGPALRVRRLVFPWHLHASDTLIGRVFLNGLLQLSSIKELVLATSVEWGEEVMEEMLLGLCSLETLVLDTSRRFFRDSGTIWLTLVVGDVFNQRTTSIRLPDMPELKYFMLRMCVKASGLTELANATRLLREVGGFSLERFGLVLDDARGLGVGLEESKRTPSEEPSRAEEGMWKEMGLVLRGARRMKVVRIGLEGSAGVGDGSERWATYGDSIGRWMVSDKRFDVSVRFGKGKHGFPSGDGPMRGVFDYSFIM